MWHLHFIQTPNIPISAHSVPRLTSRHAQKIWATCITTMATQKYSYSHFSANITDTEFQLEQLSRATFMMIRLCFSQGQGHEYLCIPINAASWSHYARCYEEGCVRSTYAPLLTRRDLSMSALVLWHEHETMSVHLHSLMHARVLDHAPLQLCCSRNGYKQVQKVTKYKLEK